MQSAPLLMPEMKGRKSFFVENQRQAIVDDLRFAGLMVASEIYALRYRGDEYLTEFSNKMDEILALAVVLTIDCVVENSQNN